MSVQIRLGASENLGELITIRKQKCYAGQSSITGKSLKHTCYIAYLFNPNNKTVGYLTSDQAFTTEIFAKTLSELKQYLKQHGYTNFEIELQ